MVVDCVPACIRDIVNDAKDLCDTKFSYSHFAVLLTGIFFGLNTFSQIARVLVFSCSVSALSRTVRHIPHEALQRRSANRVRTIIEQLENPERRFFLIVDDTLVRKFGSINDNCYWFDHCIGKTILGRNYLVITVFDSYTGQSFPVSCKLLYGKKHSKYELRIEVLKAELLSLKAKGLGSLNVVADSWFADSKFFEWLTENNFFFEIEVKSNRKITYLDKKSQGIVVQNSKIMYPSISDIACNLMRNTVFSDGAYKKVASGVVRLLGSNLRLKFAAVWNQHDSKNDRPFAIYATNKTTMCASRIWALSRFRWSIECHFRKSKQNFCFDSFPVQSADVAFNLIVLGMFLICSLELQRHDIAAVALGKQEIHKKYESLSSMVKKIRTQTEEFVFKRAIFLETHKKSIQKHFNGRKSSEYAVSKPRDKNKIQIIQESQAQLRLSVA